MPNRDGARQDLTPDRPRVAVDAMGGDQAPQAIVAGAVDAARHGVPVLLVGDTRRVEAALEAVGAPPGLPIEIADAPDAVGMDEAPLAALRRKPRTSIRIAAELVAQGRAAALLSAGHTGATLLAAHSVFGVLDGVDRPALAVTIPTRHGSAILLDAGANVDCRPAHLLQFAIMGDAFARIALGRDRPRVGLLSIGEEAGKGNDLTRDAHDLLAAAAVDFVGNVEAQAIFSGVADVIVCDGFAGNVALKVGEGLVGLATSLLRDELTARLGADAAADVLASIGRQLDYAERGAAPLLGVGRPTLVAHGRSSPRAIANAIRTASALAADGIVERLIDAMTSAR
jgi:glycerol-3-phosphate acyltransferase PlsX